MLSSGGRARSICLPRWWIILAGESALKVWRNHRGMTLATLGNAAGVGQSHLSQIENGSRRGTLSLWRKLAEALAVSADDILPLD
jgi:transcriptional regulator with XRE-family HTH domain